MYPSGRDDDAAAKAAFDAVLRLLLEVKLAAELLAELLAKWTVGPKELLQIGRTTFTRRHLGLRHDSYVDDRRSDAGGEGFHGVIEGEQRPDTVVTERGGGRSRSRRSCGLGETEVASDPIRAIASAAAARERARVGFATLTWLLLSY